MKRSSPRSTPRQDHAARAASPRRARMLRRVLQDGEGARVEEGQQAAGRVEEVDGVARRRRVDDEQVVVAGLRQTQHATRPPCTRRCRRACPTGSGRGGCRGCAAPAPASPPSPTHQLVERALHVEQHGVEARAAGERHARGACRRASPSPSASRRRCAGSTVRTAVRRPRRAAATARAAAVVVLPTPPLPTQRTTSALVEQLGERHAASRAARPSSRASASRPPSASGPANRNGRRTGAVPSARRRTCDLARRLAPALEQEPRGVEPRMVLAALAASRVERRLVGGAEVPRRNGVDDRRPDRQLEPSAPARDAARWSRAPPAPRAW